MDTGPYKSTKETLMPHRGMWQHFLQKQKRGEE